ncbi:MAG: hypothetical protein AB7O52_16935 [Planctomycetota bacterium]
MARISRSFEAELRKSFEGVATDLTNLLGLPVTFDLGNLSIASVHDLLGAGKAGHVCCRACYIRNASGVGGILVSERLALLMAYAAMLMDPPRADEPFVFGGFVEEALTEIWNVLLGSWNRLASPDARMSTKVDERAVEHYPAGLALPPEAGVHPESLRIVMRVGGEASDVAVFLPVRELHATQATIPSDVPFVRRTAPASGSEAAPGGGGGPARETATTAPCPVMFVDHTGLVLRFLRQAARSGQVQFVREEALEPGAISSPRAVIVAGADANLLQRLGECPVVSVRTRSPQPA